MKIVILIGLNWNMHIHCKIHRVMFLKNMKSNYFFLSFSRVFLRTDISFENLATSQPTSQPRRGQCGRFSFSVGVSVCKRDRLVLRLTSILSVTHAHNVVCYTACSSFVSLKIYLFGHEAAIITSLRVDSKKLFVCVFFWVRRICVFVLCW